MSGDLLRFQRIGAIGAVDFLAGDRRIEAAGHDHLGSPAQDVPIVLVERVENARLDLMHLAAGAVLDRALAGDAVDRLQRSEEHTSELQPLMRISYAVFCLKKKK